MPIESVGASGVWSGWVGLYGRPPCHYPKKPTFASSTRVPTLLHLLRVDFLSTETMETMETSVPNGDKSRSTRAPCLGGQVSLPTQPRTVPMDTMTPFRKTYPCEPRSTPLPPLRDTGSGGSTPGQECTQNAQDEQDETHPCTPFRYTQIKDRWYRLSLSILLSTI